MKTHFFRIYKQVNWANEQILGALQQTEGEPEKALKLFSHILAAENVWLVRLNEKDSSQVSIWPTDTIQDCERLVKENHRGFELFLEKLADHDLQKMIQYRNSIGTEFHTSVIDILTHVALHGSYHRGQINSLLRNDGFDPANTDYITYVRQL